MMIKLLKMSYLLMPRAYLRCCTDRCRWTYPSSPYQIGNRGWLKRL